ncbi:PglZ domain-containing protein [Calditrichota bacterium GD2]
MDSFEKKFNDWLKQKIKQHGIVLWYDPDENYSFLLEHLDLGDYPFFRYEGSFFKLRYQIEPLLKKDQKPQMLIYVPLARDKSHFALIEAESAGCYLMPGHPERDFNSSLDVRVFNWYKSRLQQAQLNTILQKIKKGEYDLEDVRRIINNQYQSKHSDLQLVYEKADPLEIIAAFLFEVGKDSDLSKKNGLAIIKSLAEDILSMEVNPNWTVEQTRKQIFTVLLISEFIHQTQLATIPDRLQKIAECPQEVKWTNRLRTIQLLRDQRKATKIYQDMAGAVQDSYGLAQLSVNIDQMLKTETFPFIEVQVIEHGLQLLNVEKADDLQSLLEKRKSGFWAEQPPYNMFWKWLQNGVQFLMVRQNIHQELKGNNWTVEQFFKAYTDPETGWWRLDQLFRFLEENFHSLNLDILNARDRAELARVHLQQMYKDTLYELAEYFQNLIKTQGYNNHKLLYQKQIFNQTIVRQKQQFKKIAYFWVDALRFELGISLFKALKNGADVELDAALGQLPAITSIGMAALLPGAEGQIKLVTDKNYGLGLAIGEHPLFTRADRLAYLKSQLEGENIFEVKLDKLRNPSKKIRTAIEEADIIIITSQEFDQLGEGFEVSIARHLMEEILQTLRTAVHNLLQAGVQYMVITGDHGYLFGNDLTESEKIDEPGGQRISLHRRVWVGKGGKHHPGYLSFKESDFGLNGDFEIVFPTNIACFKTPGGNEAYFHGGISLQELAIPVIMVRPGELRQRLNLKSAFTLTLTSPKITNRLFTVKLDYAPTDIFAPETFRVQLQLQYGSQPAGVVRLAQYGFDQDSNDIILRKNESNLVTIQLEKDDAPMVDLLLIDPETMQPLVQLKEIPVELLI